MAKHYQVLHGGALKSVDTNESNEHQRKYSEEKWKQIADDPKNNIDRSRGHLNFEIGKGVKMYPLGTLPSVSERYKARLAETGAPDPNRKYIDAQQAPPFRVAYEMILSGDTELMREYAFGDQIVNYEKGADNSRVQRKQKIEQWATDIYHAASEKFGEDNIIGFSVHLDESSPHIHCVVTPVYPKIDKATGKEKKDKATGKTMYKVQFRDTFGGDKNVLGHLHDYFYQQVNRYWGLDRGESVAITGAEHVNKAEYYRDLKQKSKQLDEEISRKGKAVKGLTTMVGNLKDKIAELESDIEIKQQDFYLANADTDRLQREIASKKRQLEELQAKLADKEQKLEAALQKIETANQKLDEIDNKCREADERLANTKDVIKNLLPNAQQKSINLAESLAWNAILNELTWARQEMARIRPTLPIYERKAFELCEDTLYGGEDNMLTDLTELGDDIVAVAANLFLGYVEGAMRYAQSKGGGGEGPKSDWGKKKDEDDRKFMGRCFLMARAMMKPVRQIPVHRGYRR